jgi:hypothetical protein
MRSRSDPPIHAGRGLRASSGLVRGGRLWRLGALEAGMVAIEVEGRRRRGGRDKLPPRAFGNTPGLPTATYMSTALIIVIAVWNLLLLFGLVIGVLHRERILRWVTGLDHEVRNLWDLNDDVWEAFLAQHRELTHEADHREAGCDSDAKTSARSGRTRARFAVRRKSSNLTHT